MTLFLNTTMEHILTWKAKSCIYVDSSFVCVCSDLQSPNKPTVPQEKIRPLTSLDHPQSPFYDPEGGAITPVARVVVERIARKVCPSIHLSPLFPFLLLLNLSHFCCLDPLSLLTSLPISILCLSHTLLTPLVLSLQLSPTQPDFMRVKECLRLALRSRSGYKRLIMWLCS